jgi:hypothetical protein
MRGGKRVSCNKETAAVVGNGWQEFARMADGEKKWWPVLVARDSGDGRVVIMAVAREDRGSGQWQWWLTITVAKDNGGGQQWHPRSRGRLQWGKDNSGKRWRRQQSGNYDCCGRRQWRRTTMAMADNNGGRQQRRWATTACKIVWRTMTGKDESGRQVMVETAEWRRLKQFLI